jgi:hypothetical protein
MTVTWVDYEPGQNCVMALAMDGPRTLREVAPIYGKSFTWIALQENKAMDRIHRHLTVVT